MPQLSAKRTGRGGDAAPLMAPQTGWFKVANALVSTGRLAALSGSAVKVYLVLLRLADREQLAWPSMETIGRFAGFSVRTATDAVDELEQQHLIQRERGHTGRSNRYRLLPLDIRKPASDHRKPASDIRKPASDVPVDSPAASPKPASDHPGNPLPITPEAGFHPFRLLDPDLKNQNTPVAAPQEKPDPTSLGFSMADFGLPAQESSHMKSEISHPKSPASAIKPPPLMKREQVEAWERYHARRRAQLQQDRTQAAEAARRTSDRLAALSRDELNVLKTQALAQLPATLAEMLKPKDPLSSPTLRGMIVKALDAI